MAKREISIVLRAKNAMAVGIAKAGAQLKKFGASAAKIGKMFAKGFLVAGAAVAAFGVKALKAYSIQESAEKQASAALEAHGDAIAENMVMLKQQASAIQDETGVADENILARMARLRMLGVEAGALADAARATIALKAAGMEEAAAIKAVAMARGGDFEMLRRYLPELRTATTELEKARIVNDFVTKGYAQQEAQLGTVGGQWEVLKGRVGDVWEEFGKAIAQSGQLKGALQAAGDKVKEFGQNVAQWIAGGGVINAMATLKLTLEGIRNSFAMIGNASHIAFAAIADGGATVWQVIGGPAKAFFDAIIDNFKGMANVAKASWDALKNPGKETLAALGSALKDYAKKSVQSWVNIGKETVKAAKGGIEVVSERTQAALDARTAMQEEHAERVKKISADQAAALIAHEQDVADAADDAEQKKLDIAKTGAAERKRIAKELATNEKKIADLNTKLEAQRVADRKKALSDKIKDEEKTAAKLLKIAEQSVQDMLDAQRAGDGKAKEAAAEDRKAARLQRKKDIVGRLQGDQKAFLDAFNKRKGAQAGLVQGAKNIAQAKNNLAQLNKGGLPDLTKMEGKLDDANKQRATLIKQQATLLTMA